MMACFVFLYCDAASPEIYTLSLHDALPILIPVARNAQTRKPPAHTQTTAAIQPICRCAEKHRSEEHTSELQSQSNLVCRLLLEKKMMACFVARKCFVACRLMELSQQPTWPH